MAYSPVLADAATARSKLSAPTERSPGLRRRLETCLIFVLGENVGRDVELVNVSLLRGVTNSQHRLLVFDDLLDVSGGAQIPASCTGTRADATFTEASVHTVIQRGAGLSGNHGLASLSFPSNTENTPSVSGRLSPMGLRTHLCAGLSRTRSLCARRPLK